MVLLPNLVLKTHHYFLVEALQRKMFHQKYEVDFMRGSDIIPASK